MPACFVVYIGYTLELPFLHQIGNIFYELLLVDAIRNLCYHNLVVVIASLYFGLGPHHDSATSCFVSLLHAFQAIDIGTCGEVGGWNILHQVVDAQIGVIDIGTTSVDNLPEVMGGNICGHTHGNTVSSVHQKVWHLCGHYGRLEQGIVEVACHVDRFLLQVVHNMLTHPSESALRITHGSRRIAIHATKVSLSINELIAHVPLLSHSHEGSINGTVAMGMVFT